MDESGAMEILDKCNIGYNSPYYDIDRIVDGECCLDGWFTADELEAIVWWMRYKGGNNAT